MLNIPEVRGLWENNDMIIAVNENKRLFQLDFLILPMQICIFMKPGQVSGAQKILLGLYPMGLVR